MDVTDYLAALPEERRAATIAIRKVIKKSLDGDYEEGILYGMLSYFVPHRVFPKGYHCDPKKPLMFIGLASKKDHMSLHLPLLYMNEAEATWFKAQWGKTKKKLDMGKGCVRFKTLDDLPLELVGQAVARMPARGFVEVYEALRKDAKPAPRKPQAAPRKAKPSPRKPR